MNSQLLIVFIVLNIANVIIQTVKSLATVKCGKGVAAIVNAIAYGLYTVVTVYLMCELPLGWKAGIVAACNLVGVYVVKWCEEKARKDKLWKVEATFKHDGKILADLREWAEANDIGYKYNDIVKYYEIDFYSHTQHESALIRDFVKAHNGKYFVSESKSLD